MLSLIVKEEENRLKVEYQKNDANINRFWLLSSWQINRRKSMDAENNFLI